jgi:Cu/Ag efflux pump CusA
VKDVAKVYTGNVPRLGKAGRDNEDDVVAAIVIMNRTLHTNDVVARVRAEVDKINNDGTRESSQLCSNFKNHGGVWIRLDVLPRKGG